MNSTITRALTILFISILLAGFSFGQVAIGTPPFATISGGSFDSVDLGNLNVHFSVPIVHKAGRGTPFDYQMKYDSSIWTTATVGSSTAWAPVPNISGFQLWGWGSESTGFTGALMVYDPKLQCTTTRNGFR